MGEFTYYYSIHDRRLKTLTHPTAKERARKTSDFKELLSEVQNGKCSICGGTLPYRAYKATIEHTYPKSKGGQDMPGNMTLAHFECNNLKADRAPYPCEVLFLMAVNLALGLDSPHD